jgi:hypothetical protein
VGCLAPACTCITSAHDAHMCIDATQEPCWLQAAPPVTPDRNASRADRQARRLGITSQPDTAAGPGRRPDQPSAANAAACFEALDRAVASKLGLHGSGDAGEAVSSKGAAGGQGHKDAVSSTRGGGKSSFCSARRSASRRNRPRLQPLPLSFRRQPRPLQGVSRAGVCPAALQQTPQSRFGTQQPLHQGVQPARRGSKPGTAAAAAAAGMALAAAAAAALALHRQPLRQRSSRSWQLGSHHR